MSLALSESLPLRVPSAARTSDNLAFRLERVQMVEILNVRHPVFGTKRVETHVCIRKRNTGVAGQSPKCLMRPKQFSMITRSFEMRSFSRIKA
ncbi:unnamed protein product [Aphanomyces euteiches]|uniref:Uncharacterized protein n=1 Tax=Aphanomyces euteiches TaxID=100861 RepID=A0A6G0WMZ8_9STRA|nr:hypothetical protein Ae201684_013478 [Aphanomyces euteiches]